MPLAVTHVIMTIVIVDLYRHYIAKNSFSRAWVLLAGFFGLLPDADIPLSWLVSFVWSKPLWLHRTYSHAVIWAALFLVTALVVWWLPRKRYWSMQKKHVVLFFVMLCVGWGSHVFLDCLFTGNERLSWIPFVLPFNTCPKWATNDMLAGIDAMILLLWLGHEEVKHKIKDYF